jgi:hypothetical protein
LIIAVKNCVSSTPKTGHLAKVEKMVTFPQRRSSNEEKPSYA